jgi:ABC-type multidrug transport system ATPase subunit
LAIIGSVWRVFLDRGSNDILLWRATYWIVKHLGSDMSFVVVNGISKTFGRGFALRDVGFTVHAGEVLGLIGPNGAGKTTLFECVAGTMAAEAGTVHVREQAIAPSNRKDVLFYLPDRIAPWAAQSVNWVLGLFER